MLVVLCGLFMYVGLCFDGLSLFGLVSLIGLFNSVDCFYVIQFLFVVD